MFNKFIINYNKLLSDKYDREIRIECKSNCNLIDECMKENFNDKFLCEQYIKNFNNCIKNFDNEFRKKYNIKKI